MFCNNCGNELKPGAEFCGKCGKQVSSSTEPTPEATSKQEGKSKSIWVGVISILAFIAAFAGVRYLTQETVSSVISNDPVSKQEIIDEMVQTVRSSTTFPYELDDVTTWTGITGTSNSIRYQYTFHDMDISEVNNSRIKEMLVPSVCQDTNTRAVLDMDINMDYSYSVEDSTQTYFVSVSKADCV